MRSTAISVPSSSSSAATFPFNAKLCLNGHEYAKRQLAREGIAFEALDNGVLSCAAPARLQNICDGLSAEKIDGFLRKWGAVPHLHRHPGCHAGLERLLQECAYQAVSQGKPCLAHRNDDQQHL
jgi:hypothetical protein